MPAYKHDNKRLNHAIRFAVDHHAGQLRKGTTRPYIIHPLEVMSILMRMNADTDLMIAGVLHDTVEDTDATIEQIVELFGEDVGALVGHHSEDKSKTWQERKSHAIRELHNADPRLKMLVMADKLSNLRSIAADYREQGEELWTRFNAPKEKQSWCYSEIQDALWDMQLNEDTASAYWEVVGLYKDVFVEFMRFTPLSDDDADAHLLQVPAHGSAVRLNKGNPRWCEVDLDTINPENYQHISRRELEETEDEWNKPFWTRIEDDLDCSRKTILLDGTNPLADITLVDGKLSVSGQDIGPQCQPINGKNEYEYFITLDEENTKRLLVHLRIERDIEMGFGELLAGMFPSETFSASFMDFCDNHGVDYTFHNF